MAFVVQSTSSCKNLTLRRSKNTGYTQLVNSGVSHRGSVLRQTRKVSCEAKNAQKETADLSRRACLGLAVGLAASGGSSAFAKQLNPPSDCGACCNPTRYEKCDARGWPSRVGTVTQTASDGSFTLLGPETWNVMDIKDVLERKSRYEGTWYYGTLEEGITKDMEMKLLLVPKKAPYDYRISLSGYTKPTEMKSIEELGDPEQVAELLSVAAHNTAQQESDIAADISKKGKLLSAGSYKEGGRVIYEIHMEVVTSGNFQASPRWTDIRALTVKDGVLYQVRGTYPQWKFGPNTNWRGEIADLVTSIEFA